MSNKPEYLIIKAQTAHGRDILNRGRYLITDQPGPGRRISPADADMLIKAGRAEKAPADE